MDRGLDRLLPEMVDALAKVESPADIAWASLSGTLYLKRKRSGRWTKPGKNATPNAWKKIQMILLWN